MENPSIKCNVNNCKYNSSSNCSLKDITVGKTSGAVSCKEDTECASFEIH